MSLAGNTISALEVKVSDDIGQRAADCTIVLAAVGAFAPPPIEFSIPGDTQTLTSTTLRPTGTIITVKASYANIPTHNVFRGLVEYMDDLADATKDLWTVKLSAMPRNFPHRKAVTRVFNSFFTDKAEATHSTDILTQVCLDAALTVGRNDLPDYVIVGTYEVIHKTPVQTAEALAQPFNLFDFLKYYVRTDADGLQILGVDYTADPKGGVYDIPNVISVERTFEAYMPETRVGDGNVLLTGGDIIVIAGGPDAATFGSTVTKTFTSSTQDTQTIAGFKRWAERRVNIQFVCRWNGSNVAGGDLDTLITALKNGQISNLQIVETYTLSDETFEYDSINGLIRSTHSYFTYQTKTFQDNTYMSFSVTRKVITQDETQEYIYPRGQKFNKSLNRRVYSYNKLGIQTNTSTWEYFGIRQEWVLNDVKIDQGDIVGATTAEIQFYAANKKAVTGEPVQAAVGTDGITGIIKAVKTQIGKYQLYNGVQLPVLSQDLLNNPFDPNLNFALLAFERQTAYQISCQNMNYDGLLAVWSLVLKQRDLEHHNAYWEIVKVRCSVDTIPVVGSSAKANGFYGWVTSVEHDLDANSALSTIVLKRIVVPK